MNSTHNDQHSLQITELESSILKIRLSPARERRLIIMGDRAIERDFYRYLEATGSVYYQGGMPVITISAAASIRAFKKFLRKNSQASAVHALTLTLRREGWGIVRNIKAAIVNYLPGFRRRHQLHVLVVGKQELVNAKFDELATFLFDLEKKGFVDLGKVQEKHGRTFFSAKRALKLTATATLSDVFWYLRHKSTAAERIAQEAYALSQAGSHTGYEQAPEMNMGMGYPAMNPATGLMMVENTMMDVGGNTYGFDNTDFQQA